MQAAAAAVAEEVAWGHTLLALHRGLLAGRRFIWEEASRKIGILALAPAALRPEHLVQVLPCYRAHLHLEGTKFAWEALHKIGILALAPASLHLVQALQI